MHENTNIDAQTAVLITGGTGMIGRAVTRLLQESGFTVSHLTRDPASNTVPGVRSFGWNVERGKIDAQCVANVGTIIHLAGESVAGKPWTKKRMDEILKSRVDSAALLLRTLQQNTHQVHTLISGSAVGYYGDRGDELLFENSTAGNDFLARVCVEWEKSADLFGEAGVQRIVKLRTGIVLGKDSGALVPISKAVKAGVGSPLGNGKQWMPWIHLDDMASIIVHLVKDAGISGAFNLAAPNPVTNREFTSAIARKLRKPMWLPAVPAFALRLVLGKMSQVVLMSNRTAAEKIIGTGFSFRYTTIETALDDLLGATD